MLSVVVADDFALPFKVDVLLDILKQARGKYKII